MRTDKDKAFELRRSGKSYKEIKKELNVSLSTLSQWFKNIDFSADIKRNLIKLSLENGTKRIIELNRTRGTMLEARYEQGKAEALSELALFINNPLFVSCISLYWGEGDKTSRNQIRLTNTDPEMLILFKQFLLEICCIAEDKIRGAIFIYEDLNSELCKKYWSEKLKINNFHKTMVLPSRHKTRRLPFGTCTIIVSNTYLKQKMLVWIDQLPKMVLNIVPQEK